MLEAVRDSAEFQNPKRAARTRTKPKVDRSPAARTARKLAWIKKRHEAFLVTRLT